MTPITLYSRSRIKFSATAPAVTLGRGTTGNGLQVATATRVIIAAAFLLASADLARPGWARSAQVVVAAYLFYSAVLFYQHGGPIWFRQVSAYVDLCIFGFLFAVLSVEALAAVSLGMLFTVVAGVRASGFVSGVTLAAIAAGSTLVTSLRRDWYHPIVGPKVFWLSPLLLLVVGYVIADSGGSAITAKRRLGLLQDITHLSNARFGAERTIAALMARLNGYFRADTCLLISAAGDSDEFVMQQMEGAGNGLKMRTEVCGNEIKDQLLSLPEGQGVLYRHRRSHWLGLGRVFRAMDFIGSRQSAATDSRQLSEKVAAILDVNSFLSVPLVVYGRVKGRIYVAAKNSYRFSYKDVSFLYDLLTRVLPLIENVRVLDRLATDAANHEREKLARDIHDTVIQPYIGIQLGLAAIRKKIGYEQPAITEDVERLMAVTELEISNLRNYMFGVRSSADRANSLLAAVQRFVDRYSAATGISVELQASEVSLLGDRLAAEVFQIIAEALSNIRRHTLSDHATVVTAAADDCFRLRIANNSSASEKPVPFIPRSIAERAAALGGRADVEITEAETRVIVEIPL